MRSRLARIRRQKLVNGIFVLTSLLVGEVAYISLTRPSVVISPLSEKIAPHGVEQVQAKEVTPTPLSKFVIGEASYYSFVGCLGCDSNRIMANGEKLDDSKLTLALTPATVKKYKLLNDKVKIINLGNGHTTYAKVTDTGGFAKYNRVADLSVATKNAIGCKSLCQVKIIFD